MKQANICFSKCSWVITWLCSPQACDNNNNNKGVEKSGLFTKVCKFSKHLCNASDNHKIFKHNQTILWLDFYKV